MTNAPTTHLDVAGDPRRALRRVSRPSRARVASWTGRSAVSSATDTALSRIATAGARKTRVSEMRGAAARAAARRPVQGTSAAAAGATTSQRRWSSGPATPVSG